MSGSEGGMMTSKDVFGMGLQKCTASAQSMRLSFSSDGAAIYKPVAEISPNYHQSTGVNVAPAPAPAPHGGGGMNTNSSMGVESMKRKRGRPRKYGPDGTMSLGLTPAVPEENFSPSSLALTSGGSGSATPFKKSRGRPRGSSSKHKIQALGGGGGSTGVGFAPHVITVKAGEDVSSKIMAFSQHGPRAVFILSANGSISNVTLRQPATSGGTVTYEGRFEILTLSGSFMVSEGGGQSSRSGVLSVSLSGPDGRVLGGSVAGILTAASPVQIIVGSFKVDDGSDKEAKHLDTWKVGESGGVATGTSSSPTSRGGTFSGSSGGGGGGPGSPLNNHQTSTGGGGGGMLFPTWK